MVDVLDHGWVELEEVMGGQEAIVAAARTTTRSRSEPERDEQLLRVLLARDETSVFEHCVFRFRVRCPLFVARQWMRHRIGSYSERSLRRTEADMEFYLPSTLGERELAHYREALDVVTTTYDRLRCMGVPREVARMVLPVCLYTEFVWTVNARSLVNFLDQRLRGDAQWEIRQYAWVVYHLACEALPVLAYRFGHLTSQEA